MDPRGWARPTGDLRQSRESLQKRKVGAPQVHRRTVIILDGDVGSSERGSGRWRQWGCRGEWVAMASGLPWQVGLPAISSVCWNCPLGALSICGAIQSDKRTFFFRLELHTLPCGTGAFGRRCIQLDCEREGGSGQCWEQSTVDAILSGISVLCGSQYSTEPPTAVSPLLLSQYLSYPSVSLRTLFSSYPLPSSSSHSHNNDRRLTRLDLHCILPLAVNHMCALARSDAAGWAWT